MGGAVAFKQIETLKPQKSLFDLSYEYKATGDMGMLIPVMVKEAIPGDVWKMSMTMILRFAPMIWPLFHEVNAKTFTFFVPNRHLFPKQKDPTELSDIEHSWENFITGGEDGNDESQLPLWVPDPATDLQKQSIWDYMGLPMVALPSGSQPNLLALRAYNEIWNEYFRDQNMSDMPWVDLDDRNLKYAAWEKDYFSGALPFQQRGTQPAIPLSGLGSVEFGPSLPPNQPVVTSGGAFTGGTPPVSIGPNVKAGFSTGYNEAGQVVALQMGVGETWSKDAIYNWGAPSRSDTLQTSFNQGFVDYLNANSLNLQDAIGIDLSAFRTGFQTLKWMERNARCGARYVEQLQARFNETAGDARLQRPEFIGGTKTPIVVSEVLQTGQGSGTSGGQWADALGSMAGHGLSADDSEIGTYRAREHGWIITLLCVRPVPGYQQGIHPQFTRRTRFDILTPEFVNLSEQAVYNREIMGTTNEEYNSEIFGYQGRYNEYRYSNNMSVGLMRDDFAFTHLNRIFDPASPPLLNKQFIECKPDKRIFAVPSEPSFFLYYGANNQVVRPLPIIPEPGLVDHH